MPFEKRVASSQRNLRRSHVKALEHGTPSLGELCQTPSPVMVDQSLGTPGLSKVCPSPSNVKDLCFGTIDWNKLSPSAFSPSDVEDLSLGTPGDVKDLCFDTIDLNKLSPPTYSPSDVGDLNLDILDFYKLSPPPASSYYDVNDDADGPYEGNSSRFEEEYTSEDEDDEDEDDSGLIKEILLALKRPLASFQQYRFQDKVMSYRSTCDLRSPSISLEVSQWVATWKELDVRAWTWIHVHAYYSKNKCHGGYGVIVCDALGKPIIAKANFSKTGISFFHQVFKGISAGVELAVECKRDGFHVGSNSLKLPCFFGSFKLCTHNKCKNTSDPKCLCKECKNIFIVEHFDMDTVLFVQKLRQRKLREMKEPSSLAAHYLAKMEKLKMLEVEKKEESSATADDGSVYFPNDFPEGLKNLLWLEKSDKTVRS